MAIKFGLKRSSLSDIENGRANITARTQILICQIFGVNPTWLENGTGEIFLKNNLKENEFFEIFENLHPSLQDFILKTAKTF